LSLTAQSYNYFVKIPNFFSDFLIFLFCLLSTI